MAHMLSSFIESEGWFFEHINPTIDRKAAIQAAVESTLEGRSSNDERRSEISLSRSGSDGLGISSGRYINSCSLASSTSRSTSSIAEFENVDCKSTGSGEGPENDEHNIRAVAELKRVFGAYDENGDGYVCKSELEKFTRKLDIDVSEEEILSMMESADVNGDGYVDFEEFLELHTSLAQRDEVLLGCGAEQDNEDAELLEAFQVFDRNHDGFISEIELQTVLRNLGINPGVKIQDCQRMISAFDRNNDGQVDFSEFQELMSSISCAA